MYIAYRKSSVVKHEHTPYSMYINHFRICPLTRSKQALWLTLLVWKKLRCLPQHN